MKKQVKKLALAKETVMNLGAGETKGIGGGTAEPPPETRFLPCNFQTQNTRQYAGCPSYEGCPTYQC